MRAVRVEDTLANTRTRRGRELDLVEVAEHQVITLCTLDARHVLPLSHASSPHVKPSNVRTKTITQILYVH